MDVDLNKLHYSFTKKPLLIGGKAMEYYGLRKSGWDIDFVASEEDVMKLIELYPQRVKDLWGDLGVCPYEFEIWRTINLFDYTYYKEKAIEKDTYLIISLEKLLVMKALAIKKEKYLKDVNLIVNHIIEDQETKYEEQKRLNKHILKKIENIIYIEKTGPEEK
jgi:hypothetical protein